MRALSATVRVVPLTSDTWPGLVGLFTQPSRVPSCHLCWCGYWRLRAKDFAAAKVPELRARLRGLAEGPTPPGLVALDGERAVGWVSLGPRADFERIERSRVIPRIDDRPAWSIVCFAVSATARGRGVATALLGAAIEYARTSGATVLEAYPVMVETEEGVESGAAFTGTLTMFERAGFRVVADRASDPAAAHRRVVVRRDLGAGPI